MSRPDKVSRQGLRKEGRSRGGNITPSDRRLGQLLARLEGRERFTIGCTASFPCGKRKPLSACMMMGLDLPRSALSTGDPTLHHSHFPIWKWKNH